MKSGFLRITICVVTFLVATVARLSADDSYSRASAERYIMTSEAAWAESVPTNNPAVVERILASDVVWVLDGQVWNKARAVADAKAGPGDFLSDHLDYAHVRFFGETAVVQGMETWTRTGRRTGHFVWTDTWVRRNGQWQIVAAEDITTPMK